MYPVLEEFKKGTPGTKKLFTVPRIDEVRSGHSDQGA
jgi:hypothetical protein